VDEKAVITRRSVEEKLERYLLNPDHPLGKEKAQWFERALGFTRRNRAELAQQIVFEETAAVVIETTQHGTIYNQVIPIVGANGRKIEVVFGWIRRKADGTVRLVTAFPIKRP
jgi:hypothetical protein